jgi:hypothetical protein
MSDALTANRIAALAAGEKIDPALVKTISDAAVKHDVDPMLLLAVAKHESDFGRSSFYDSQIGKGDGGNGYGIFQLDKRTPSHVPNLPLVAHDNAKAADIAAEMMREALDHSKGDVMGALRYYNSGHVNGNTTMVEYNHHLVPYEVAVSCHEDDLRSEAGRRIGVEPAHREPLSSKLAPPDQRDTAQFIRQEHVLRVVDGQGHVHEFAAYNNARHPNADPNVKGANGPAPDGTFPLGTLDRSIANGENGSYGPIGGIPIGGETGTKRGLLIHSGRGDDPSFQTLGCIRTTDEAMRFLRDHPPSQLTIEETRSPSHERPYAASTESPTHQSPRAWHISGESMNGVVVESSAVLEQKNALLQIAIEGAKNGQSPVFTFTATPGESKQTVQMQNQFMDRAVAMHLPAAERAAFCKEKGIDLGPVITGQKGLDGKPLESSAELEAKNAKLQKAIVLAQHGIVDRVPFKGDGKESADTVKAQNELLQAAIHDNLPPTEARETDEPSRKKKLDAAIEKFNAENPNRPLPAAREAVDWDKSRSISGTMLEISKEEYAVNLGRGLYAFVESSQLSRATPAPNTYVELGRDGAVNGAREVAMTPTGR